MSETSIVLQLQELAVDPNSNIEELLNKALLVARKLKIKKFRKWCESELKGYDKENIPDYRIIKGQLKVFNPYHGLQPFIIPDTLDKLVTTIKIKQSVGEINNLLSQEGNSFESVISNEVKSKLMSMQKGFTQLEPRVMFERSQLLSVSSKLRNIILNWSLQLEEDGILGEGMKFSEKEKKAAMSVNNFNIQNMQGVVGTVSGGTINQNNQMNIAEYDFDSLAKYLMENKVGYTDIQKLEVAIKEDPKPKDSKKLGVNVSEWIANMMGKAANGSWEIGIATAGTLLAESISKFYGI
ncbi:hypothetical protein [Acinetobacter oleivorans]|uniref:AbiTii domain-containing protein n=1 Tax=Acinetobacter oleivorans TaxID=1148157 RepID=UPI0011A05FD2|nr:hypothetical protein [Acinetobacter oleivorans]